MSNCLIKIFGKLSVLFLMLCPLRANSADFQLSLALHPMVASTQKELGGALNLALGGQWFPIPELAIGLEGALTFPLPTGQECCNPDLTLRGIPTLSLFLGDQPATPYLRAGVGLNAHLQNEEFTPVWVACMALGIAVSPRELLFQFGFELVGELDITGDLLTKTIGLGGWIGFRL